MSFFKKIKNLINKPKQNNAQSTPSDDRHLNPISQEITAWLQSREWKFHHITPEEDDVGRNHLFFLDFVTENFDWRLFIRVQEKLQLVSFVGSLETPVPPEYRLSAMALVAEQSVDLHFGDVGLDLSTGELRAKLYFDAEFSRLSTRLLDTQVNLLFQLLEVVHNISEQVPKMPSISDLSALLNLAKEQRADGAGNGGEYEPFFSPTQKAQ